MPISNIQNKKSTRFGQPISGLLNRHLIELKKQLENQYLNISSHNNNSRSCLKVIGFKLMKLLFLTPKDYIPWQSLSWSCQKNLSPPPPTCTPLSNILLCAPFDALFSPPHALISVPRAGSRTGLILLE